MKRESTALKIWWSRNHQVAFIKRLQKVRTICLDGTLEPLYRKTTLMNQVADGTEECTLNLVAALRHRLCIETCTPVKNYILQGSTWRVLLWQKLDGFGTTKRAWAVLTGTNKLDSNFPTCETSGNKLLYGLISICKNANRWDARVGGRWYWLEGLEHGGLTLQDRRDEGFSAH